MSSEITAELGEFGQVNLANFQMNGDFLRITIAGEADIYTKGNLGELVDNLVEARVPQGLAEKLANTVEEAFEAIRSIESTVLEGARKIIKLSHADSLSPVNIELTSNTATSIGNGTPVDVGDLVNITGSGFDDTIIGGSEANILEGGAGIDTIDGGAGDDTITGGEGNDELLGGSGFDTYFIDGGDTITDTDGSGKVNFNGLLLTRGSKEPEEHDCNDEGDERDDGAQNQSDDEEAYVGSDGETYEWGDGGQLHKGQD